MGILSKKTARVSFLAARAAKLGKNPCQKKEKKEIITPDHHMWANGSRDDEILLQQLEVFGSAGC